MSLILSNNNVNLGKIAYGQVKTMAVQIYNDSDTPEPIAISRVSCGSCTTARLAASVVPAKGNIQMTVTFTAKNQGINTKSVTLNNAIIFTFSAQVV